MLRFLLKTLLLAWSSYLLLLLAMQNIGKTTPEISKLAFFHHREDGTGSDYWRLDLFSGIAFNDDYSGRIFIPDIIQGPINHFLSVTGDANYYYVSELNLYSRELSFVAKYPSRGYTLLLAGDYIFTYDLATEWRRIQISNSDSDYFGSFPRLDDLRVSPDGQWLVGRIYTHNWLFINALHHRSYEIEPYTYLIWSPNSLWYLVGDYRTVSVLNAADGSILMADIPARIATWSPDGESLILENHDQLSLMTIQTGQSINYSAEYNFFWLQCLSPDNRSILGTDDSNIYLVNLETNSNQALLAIRNAAVITCLWSEDNRYLLFYLTNQTYQRIYFVDTMTKNTWSLYPTNLPAEPIYLHIPD